MPLLGAVADDLTGATTTGVLLACSGAKTAAFFNKAAAERCEEVENYEALIVSSNSRALPKDEAYDKVKSATQALKRMGVKYFSKRIDTTLRGCVGIEIDAMMDQLGDDSIAIVVPAMPQSKRILVGGYSIIDGVALIKTPVAQDVRTPVKENYIPKLLRSQTRRDVSLITMDKVLKGVESIKKSLQESRNNGSEVIIVDAITLEDVDMIAKACVELDWNVVAVDPGAFTSKLAYHRGIIREEKPNLPGEDIEIPNNKTVLIMAGSATSVTKRQMEVLCQDPRHFRISAEAIPLVNQKNQGIIEVERVANEAVKLLQSDTKPRALLIETALHGGILDLEEEDKKRNYTAGLSANRINAGLGMIVSKILKAVGRDAIAGIYTTGGDTMVNVCYHLGVECIELIDYIIPQTDVGRCVGGYQGMPIVGKGGLTGNDNTACDIVDRLFKEAGRTS